MITTASNSNNNNNITSTMNSNFCGSQWSVYRTGQTNLSRFLKLMEEKEFLEMRPNVNIIMGLRHVVETADAWCEVLHDAMDELRAKYYVYKFAFDPNSVLDRVGRYGGNYHLDPHAFSGEEVVKYGVAVLQILQEVAARAPNFSHVDWQLYSHEVMFMIIN